MKTALLIISIVFLYTKGTYQFFCKSCIKLVNKILPILEKKKEEYTKKEYDILLSCLWIVIHTKNKLENICSISSSVHDNKKCKQLRKIKGCICEKCYAHNQQSYQNGTREHNIINGLILRNVLLPMSILKKLVIVFPYLRVESFGDVENVTQARNYIRIIASHKDKRCTIFSKQLEIWSKAFEKEGKPKNTTFIASSFFVNVPLSDIVIAKYSFIDHCFTVYTKQYAKEHNIIINCRKKCIECIKKRQGCFYKENKNNSFFLNELLK